MITETTIVLEDKLAEMFSDLPAMSYSDGSPSFPVSFGYGDKKELNAFIKLRESNKPYPLIWLLYPYEEKHNKNRLQVDDVVFILAVPTIASMQNPQRLKETYANILIPLFDNVRWLFRRTNIVNFNDEYTMTKYPNYSDTDDGEEHAGTFIWDALKVELSFSVIDTCYKSVKFKNN